MTVLSPRIPLEKDREAHEKRFDYSETHLSANGTEKTTPKLVSLPKETQNQLSELPLASPD